LDKINSVTIDFDENRTMHIEKYAFIEKIIMGEYLFRIKGFNGVFCTDNFLRIYEHENWTGFQFEEVWRSEEE